MFSSEPQSHDSHIDAIHAAVRESRVFSSLHDAEIDEVVFASEVSRVAAGEVVCRPGDAADHVAMVVSGCLAAEAPGLCRIAPLNRIGPGEIFGEMAVLRGARRSAQVTAVEPSELLIICQAVFLSVLVRHPAVSIRILGSVSDRLHRLTEALGEDLATATAQPFARIFGFWSVAGPLLAACKIWQLQSVLEEHCQRSAAGLDTSSTQGDFEDALALLATQENPIPQEKWARRLVRLMLARTPRPDAPTLACGR